MNKYYPLTIDVQLCIISSSSTSLINYLNVVNHIYEVILFVTNHHCDLLLNRVSAYQMFRLITNNPVVVGILVPVIYSIQESGTSSIYDLIGQCNDTFLTNVLFVIVK